MRELIGRLPAPTLYVFGVPGRIRTPWDDEGVDGDGNPEGPRVGRLAGNALNEDVSIASGLAVVTVGNVGAFFMRMEVALPPSRKWPDAPLS